MKLKLFLLLVFISIYSWSQTTKSFTTNGTFIVPAGLTSIYAKAWGGGGAGGGASGAGLLWGRGAAGGSGGAAVESVLTVVPGTTLNVVVAGQTPGTIGANGTAGGHSTITQYQNIFLAAGGLGGGANNSETPPDATPAAQFDDSASTNGVTKGRPGEKGNSALLSLGLSSGAGGAGGQGINSGDGAGGAAISNLLLGTSPGNAGTASGGGGSGAINSALGAPQAGGAGAAGQVILSYTCPIYSITGVKAGSCDNSTLLTVILTSSATSLPVGNYVVTYNRTSPAATGLTANLTVTTAGTGTFTTTSTYPNNTDNSTITITKLASESCSSTITTSNTATITSIYGGTISGATATCIGTSCSLTLSGNTGLVTKWQFKDGSNSDQWTDVPNPSTATTYTSFPINRQTDFRALVVTGNCSTESQPTTVTILQIPIISNGNIFFPSDPVIGSVPESSILQYLTIIYSSVEGHNNNTLNGLPNGYSVEWNSNQLPDQNFTSYTFTATVNGNINTIVVPANTPVGTYSGNLYVYNDLCKSDKYAIKLIIYKPFQTGSEKDTNASTITTSLIPIATKDLEATENKVSVAIFNKVIHVDTYNRNINKVFVYDVSGNLLYKKEAVSGSKLVIDNLKSSNQVLLVKVISDDNHIETKKVIY
ncbi:T9SS sorting signal type C domain-containing protein [Flavobacterium sp. LS1R47]|uniref:T9SS sorting signal type C domain-containing protein n=1 Tax=Flavobacterium frigoritolerans TaxID=2987686 RepID=A0A9X2Z0Q1_9FLAO|nr:T9SS sorting signal type C domain-containing protein [Flavobacterium frigoritolerans]MCV9932914.1 T9SS sorting signal type C domain-containing protein [Flavobacterium frigoritolerans]